MKACLGDEGCGGTGRLFAPPKFWSWCVLCKGTGFIEGGPIGPAEIKMPNLGTTAAPTHTFNLSDFAEVKNPLMAHVMAKAGIFKSIGQARKNGWDKPLVVGEWTVTKKKIKIIVKA